jgi:hypothetical protein
MKFKFIVKVPEGGEFPRFYGLAWRSFYKPEVYGAIMPFHLIIGWGRHFWYKFRYPKYAKLTEPELWENLRAAQSEVRLLHTLLSPSSDGTPVTIRTVKLPDGKLAIEKEYEHIGGSEIQISYTYNDLANPSQEISKEAYRTDYWGRIEGIELL